MPLGSTPSTRCATPYAGSPREAPKRPFLFLDSTRQLVGQVRAAEPPRPLTTGNLQLPRVDRLGVVEDRMLPRAANQDLDLGLPLDASQHLDMVEQLTTRQTPEIHGTSQTPTTDTGSACVTLRARCSTGFRR